MTAWARGRLNKRKLTLDTLALEVVTEAQPTLTIIDCLAQHCPNLRDLRVDYQNFMYSAFSTSTEGWVMQLNKLKHLNSLTTSNIDHKTNLKNALAVIGSNLVILDLQVIYS